MIVRLTGLLSTELVGQLRDMLRGADFQDGSVTAGASARVVKNNQQLRSADPVARSAGAMLTQALQKHRALADVAYPKCLLPPLFARYGPGMVYGEHMDNALMGGTRLLRADLSLTVFLCETSEYEGGELSIERDNGVSLFRGEVGEGILFPSIYSHGVRPVTKGQRLVAVVWIQSVVRDAERRRLLLELSETLRDGDAAFRTGRTGKFIQKCHANLLRMWAEV